MMLFLQTPAPGPVIVSPPPEVPILPPWMTLPPQVTLLMFLGLVAGVTIVLYPLMRAIARRVERGRGGDDTVIRAELEQLRSKVLDVEHLQTRIAELEERVDFAERLLAQKREPERLRG